MAERQEDFDPRFDPRMRGYGGPGYLRPEDYDEMGIPPETPASRLTDAQVEEALRRTMAAAERRRQPQPAYPAPVVEKKEPGPTTQRPGLEARKTEDVMAPSVDPPRVAKPEKSLWQRITFRSSPEERAYKLWVEGVGEIKKGNDKKKRERKKDEDYNKAIDEYRSLVDSPSSYFAEKILLGPEVGGESGIRSRKGVLDAWGPSPVGQEEDPAEMIRAKGKILGGQKFNREGEKTYGNILEKREKVLDKPELAPPPHRTFSELIASQAGCEITKRDVGRVFEEWSQASVEEKIEEAIKQYPPKVQEAWQDLVGRLGGDIDKARRQLCQRLEAREEQEEPGLAPAARLLAPAVQVIREEGRATIEILRRNLGINQDSARAVMALMEEQGIVGPVTPGKPRRLLNLDNLPLSKKEQEAGKDYWVIKLVGEATENNPGLRELLDQIRGQTKQVLEEIATSSDVSPDKGRRLAAQLNDQIENLICTASTAARRTLGDLNRKLEERGVIFIDMLQRITPGVSREQPVEIPSQLVDLARGISSLVEQAPQREQGSSPEGVSFDDLLKLAASDSPQGIEARRLLERFAQENEEALTKIAEGYLNFLHNLTTSKGGGKARWRLANHNWPRRNKPQLAGICARASKDYGDGVPSSYLLIPTFLGLGGHAVLGRAEEELQAEVPLDQAHNSAVSRLRGLESWPDICRAIADEVLPNKGLPEDQVRFPFVPPSFISTDVELWLLEGKQRLVLSTLLFDLPGMSEKLDWLLDLNRNALGKKVGAVPLAQLSKEEKRRMDHDEGVVNAYVRMGDLFNSSLPGKELPSDLSRRVAQDFGDIITLTFPKLFTEEARTPESQVTPKQMAKSCLHICQSVLETINPHLIPDILAGIKKKMVELSAVDLVTHPETIYGVFFALSQNQELRDHPEKYPQVQQEVSETIGSLLRAALSLMIPTEETTSETPTVLNNFVLIRDLLRALPPSGRLLTSGFEVPLWHRGLGDHPLAVGTKKIFEKTQTYFPIIDELEIGVPSQLPVDRDRLAVAVAAYVAGEFLRPLKTAMTRVEKLGPKAQSLLQLVQTIYYPAFSTTELPASERERTLATIESELTQVSEPLGRAISTIEWTGEHADELERFCERLTLEITGCHSQLVWRELVVGKGTVEETKVKHPVLVIGAPERVDPYLAALDLTLEEIFSGKAKDEGGKPIIDYYPELKSLLWEEDPYTGDWQFRTDLYGELNPRFLVAHLLAAEETEGDLRSVHGKLPNWRIEEIGKELKRLIGGLKEVWEKTRVQRRRTVETGERSSF